MTDSDPKSLDHLVLPVSSLDVARARLSALGFTVAPNGYHPFGTKNACVFFEDDTYLEPLAIGDLDKYEREAKNGDSFLLQDQIYRKRNGNDGFSLIALTTNDAVTDRQAHQDLGYECGQMVSFSREVVQPDGSSGQIALKLFVTTTAGTTDLALFSCEWLSGRVFDKKHKTHANGALGIGSITLAGADSEELKSYLSTVTGQKVPIAGQILSLKNVRIELMSADQLKQFYGIEQKSIKPGLRAVAFDVIVQDLESAKTVILANGIKAQEIRQRLVVPPAEGQGYTLSFSKGDVE